MSLALLEVELIFIRCEIYRVLVTLENAKYELALLKNNGFNPNQPRVPVGNATGGEWTDTGGGDGHRKPLPLLPRPKPLSSSLRPRRRGPMSGQEREDFARRINQNAPSGLAPRDLEIEPSTGLPRWYVEGAVGDTLSPLDLIGPPVGRLLKPIAARNADRIRALGKQGISRESVTDHGGVRVAQRYISKKDVDEEIKSAKEAGNVFEKMGKYNTVQHHYHGSNGLTVIIETQGRNAGKIITTYGKKPGGKL